MDNFFVKRELCVGNTHFNHKSLHKYSTVARGQDEMEVMRIIDLKLIKRNMVHYEQDFRTVRAM